jgi:hypothetical protein
MRHRMGVALLAAVTPCVWAQSFMGPVRSFPRPNFSHFHHGVRTGTYSPVAFFDPLYSDYYSRPPAAPETRVIIAHAPSAPSQAPADFVPPAEPLLIELQDKQYVQLSGEKKSRVQILSTEERSTARQSAAAASAATPENLVLVFHDGHTEEFSAYTIADGYLYASGDYYNSGSWNRKIDLTTLNLPETVKQNEVRGISFRLPAAPNEVIVGP